MKRLVGVDEAARMLSVSRETIRKLVKRGVLPSTRIGYRVLLHVDHIEKFSRRGWGPYSPNYEMSSQASAAL